MRTRVQNHKEEYVRDVLSFPYFEYFHNVFIATFYDVKRKLNYRTLTAINFWENKYHHTVEDCSREDLRQSMLLTTSKDLQTVNKVRT